MLEVRSLSGGYNKLMVLRSINMKVEANGITVIVGPNGAGKSTLLQSIVGAVQVSPESKILFEGKDVTKTPTHILARTGIQIVSEGMNLFTGMSVRENLLLGAHPKAERNDVASSLEEVQSTFPRLRERAFQLAGTLSGGERKMLAIGRAMMSHPKLLLVDEPSLGLAPKMAQEVFATLRKLNLAGMTLVVVEQNVRSALALASHVYVIERGEFICDGPPEEVTQVDRFRRNYLAVY